MRCRLYSNQKFNNIYVGSYHFLGLKTLNFNIFFFFWGGGGVHKNGVYMFVDKFVLVNLKTGLVSGVISVHFRFSFLRPMYRMGIF